MREKFILVKNVLMGGKTWREALVMFAPPRPPVVEEADLADTQKIEVTP